MAQLYWLHACAILYGPLAPFFYGLAAAYGLFSFACTRFGVVFWYTRPPAITAKLSHHFRLMILLLLPPHLLIKLLVRIAAEPSAYWPVSCAYFLVGLGLCWLVYRKSVIGGGGVFGQILGTEPAAYEQLNGSPSERTYAPPPSAPSSAPSSAEPEAAASTAPGAGATPTRRQSVGNKAFAFIDTPQSKWRA